MIMTTESVRRKRFLSFSSLNMVIVQFVASSLLVVDRRGMWDTSSEGTLLLFLLFFFYVSNDDTLKHNSRSVSFSWSPDACVACA